MEINIMPINPFAIEVMKLLIDGKVKKYAMIYDKDGVGIGYFHSVDPESGSVRVTDDNHNIIRTIPNIEGEMFLDADIFEDCVHYKPVK